jgi:GTP-binding protein EngB required for normal cell division
MTETSHNRQAVLQDLSGDTVLYRLAELATEFGAEHIASTARSIAERVSEGRFYVACVGQFKRGKSTFLNALIGHSVLPTAVVPVTAVPTIIRHGERLAARVRFQSAAWTDIPVSTVEEYVSEDKNPENTKSVAGVEIFVPSPLLKTGMCFVDTPGLGSVFVENTAATHAFIPHIEAAIVVIGADPPLSGDELQLVEAVSQEVHDLVFVLNKADRASSSERSAALEFSRRVLETHLKRPFPAIFEVSALDRLEQKGPERDWGQMVHALEDLVLRSGRSLVRKASDRGIRRAANQLLAVIREERDTLLRPVEESEQRIAKLRETIAEGEGAMRDLGALLAGEQQRLSQVFVGRREVFLKQTQVLAQKELAQHLRSIAQRRNGPAYRRDLNHLAQNIARAQLTPWLEGEAKYAEEVFCKTAQRFIEYGNSLLRRLAETGIPGLEPLPEELGQEQSLRAQSHFYFHVMENVATPASPLLLISDLVLGGLGLRSGIVRDAQEFLDHLLEVNSSRVQNDVDERVRESRKKLDVEIKEVLREASAIADRALARAQMAQAAGTSAVERAVVRLAVVEREIRGILPSGDRAESLTQRSE